ncbi:MAG: SBBP repeat-containing protein [Saprospiraceae bacterium]|nr:SBBP repeat-containing protein [Saprospiraceae bacterium]
MRPVLRHLFILAISLLLTAPASAQFQRQFGTNLDETFNKVIKSGTNYYVLGTAEITNGQPPRATVTRLNAAGELQWTLSVNTASQWNDAVLTPNGDLLVVGRSLPDDNTSRGIMGRVTATGTFTWLRSYDQPNRDGFDRIVRNPVPQTGTHPYYVLGHQLQAQPAVDDVFLMNIDENGDINWKKIYLSSVDDEFTNVLLAMPNGDLILAGHRSGEGLIVRANNTGALFNGATPAQPFTYIDVASAGGAGFYAVGYNFQQEKVQLISFDVDLVNQWEVNVNGFTAVNNVFTAAGSIFLGGRKVREACARISVSGGDPQLLWTKTLDNGVLTQTASHLSFLSPAQLAYVDGRTVETGGFGQNCAFMSLSDLELNTCMTEVEDDVFLTSVSTLYNGPVLPDIEFYDEPMGTNLTGGPRTWQQANACPNPMNASIIGVKYKECNGLAYNDQTPIAGWTIQLLNSMGTIIGEQVTGADGSYAFTDLPLGQYIVKEIAQPGWTPNVPASGQLAVTLAASELRVVNFGNCPPPQLFCACPAGSQPANNNLATNSNFTSGNTGFSSGYTFTNTPPLQPGQYWVGSNPSQINAGFTSCGDHTTGSGNMLVVNGAASTSSTIWCQTYTVTPNSSYLFETWVASLTSASPANLMLLVNNVSYGAGFFASGTSCNWEKYCTLWESGTNTSVTLCLVDLNTAGTGNDFALDDISFKRCISPFGDITGTVYQVCDSLPFTDQPVLPGWTVQLLDDTETTVLAEQVTDANGEYAFADLPLGLYYCRVLNQPGWTPRIPFDSKYLVNLGSPDPVVRNFGICPECSCDSTYVNIQPIANSNDVSSYVVSINLRQNYCFTGIEIELAEGEIAATELFIGDLTIEMLSNNLVRLTPVSGDFIDFNLTIMRLSVTGVGDSSHITVRTTTAVLGFACTSGASFPFPNPIPASSSCCPVNSTVGSELVNDGNFGPNSTFSTDYPPSAGAVVTKSYALQNGAQTGGIWSCIGKSGDPINDYFLLINGDIGPVPAIAWKQPVTVTPGLQYTFSVAANNLTTPNPTYNPYDPNVQIQIVNALNNSIVTSQSMILPEIPDQWETICLNWTPPQDPLNPNNQYRLEILSLDLNPYGNDFALDCISFRECTPPPPCDVTINTIFVNNCGHVQLDAVASGPSGYSYQWCSGESTQMLDLMLPCGEYDFCVSVTCEDGTMASDAITVTVSDNIPPSINCPQDMTFTALAPNCDMPVFGIHSLGASDNCGTPTVTYAISGATTASGSGDASGTTFSSGTSTVTYTATDWCNNMTSCSFDVTIDCDTCACLGFQNLEFYNFLSGPNLPALCDSTSVMLPCIGSDALYWFQWSLLCSDPLCILSVDYEIVPASGGPALVSGSIQPGSPHFIAFAYNQLAGPGNYQIVLTGHCGTDSCTCTINFSVPTCCECGGFSGTTYRPTQGIMNLPFMCGDTMGVDCNQTFLPRVNGLFQCMGSSCPSNNPIQWVLTDPQGSPIQSSAGPITANPGFNFTLDPTWFVQPGTYALTMTGMCGGVACDSCVLYLESLGCTSPGDSCCFEWVSAFVGNFSSTAFDMRADQAGNTYVTGNFTSTVDFDPGPGVLNITSNGMTDVYVAKLDASGSLQWIRQIGGTNSESGYGIFVDAGGFVYVVGHFTGTVDFDPGLGIFNMTTTGQDVFVQKMDNAGNFVWAKQIGGAATVSIISETIVVDGSGNIYIGGDYNGTTDFDPGPGVFSLTGSNSFVCKLDGSGGLVWVKEFDSGGSIAKKCHALTLDPSGNIYATGYFSVPVDFDPGAAVFTLTPVGIEDVFICKLDNAGNFIYALQIAGPQGEEARAIAADAAGNINITGHFVGTMDCDPGAGVFNLIASNPSPFIAKYNPSGSLIWAKSYNSTNTSFGHSIVLDAQGNILTTGRFSGSIDFDPGVGIYNITAIGILDGFIAKLGPNGDFMWAKALHSTQAALGNAIALDGQNNVYTAGNFRGTTDFDPGTPVLNIISGSSVSAYVHKLGMCLPDTCHCGGFTDMFIRGPQGLMSRPAVCGGPPVGLGCALSGNGYMFTGIFQCDGTTCPDSTDIEWDLLDPNNGSIASGMVPSNPLFGLPLLASYFAQPGVYTLNLTGYCGNDTCTCTITLLVPDCPDPCPCDLPTLISDVNQGFAHAYSTTSCRVCFTPLGLSDCDDVEWMINSPINPPVGTSLGNQTFCHTFPSSGTYTVYMTVLRRRSDGSLCESWVYSRTIMVKCTKQAECETSVYPNPTFEEGAVLGSFLEDGTTAGWTRIWGDPHVDERDGHKVIKKRGNFNSADVTGTIEPICLAKDTGTISLRHGIKTQGIKSAIVVQFFSGDNYEFGVCESADCYEVARIELPDSDNPEEEFEVEIPYDISGWDATAACGDQPGVRVRPAIYVTGPFSDEQGPGSLTVIDLDYFCVDGSVITSQSEPELKQRLLLYPNPNTGQFTLDWQGAPWPEGRVEIAGPLGHTLRSFSVPEGAGQMEVQIADLPAGMYFVKVLSEGRVVKVMRVVKL